MARESKSAKIARTNAKTELQWNKLNRKITSWENTIDYFNNIYFPEADTAEMTDAEVQAFKDKRKAQKEERERKKREWEEYLQKKIEETYNYSTACQWLNIGRVVKDGASATLGSSFHIKHLGDEYGLGMASDYYYYHIDDTYEDAEKAEEISKTFPSRETGFKYDGCAWWI